MQVIVQEMHKPENDTMGSGGHFWVDLVFTSGRTVTVRVDEKDFHSGMSRVFVRRDDAESKEFII